MKVTLKFLSEKCGVSTTIISKIVNNKEVRVSKEKKEQIVKTLKEYNYIPDATAVSLATKKTKMIGLLIPDISNIFFAEIAKNIESILSSKGYNLIFCNTNDSLELQEEYANLLLSRGVDALIFCLAMGTRFKETFTKRFIEQSIPLIAFDRFIESEEYSSVCTDYFNGVYRGVEYLIENGHKSIGCVAGPKNSTSSNNRLEGYIQALKDNNLPIRPGLISYGDYRFDSGYGCAKQILKNKDVTAIIALNDLMAYGTYKAIEEMGLKIPDDISVIGFDDLMFSSMMSVPLTTVHQDTKVMCNNIARLVLEVLDGKEEKEQIQIAPNLIIRNSVKYIK